MLNWELIIAIISMVVALAAVLTPVLSHIFQKRYELQKIKMKVFKEFIDCSTECFEITKVNAANIAAMLRLKQLARQVMIYLNPENEQYIEEFLSIATDFYERANASPKCEDANNYDITNFLKEAYWPALDVALYTIKYEFLCTTFGNGSSKKLVLQQRNDLMKLLDAMHRSLAKEDTENKTNCSGE